MTALNTFTRLAIGATALVALGVPTVASATAYYTIDDFAHAAYDPTHTDPFQVTLKAVTGNATPSYSQNWTSYSIGGKTYSRQMNFAITESPLNSSSQTAKLTVGPDTLKISTGSQVRVGLTLQYDISSLQSVLSPGADAEFSILFSDGLANASAGQGSTLIKAYLDGTQAGTSAALTQVVNVYSGTPTPAGSVSFILPYNLINGSDILRFEISGPTGYDLTIGAIQVATVPEPAMLGLFGLGIAGLGIARRRKR